MYRVVILSLVTAITATASRIPSCMINCESKLSIKRSPLWKAVSAFDLKVSLLTTGA